MAGYFRSYCTSEAEQSSLYARLSSESRFGYGVCRPSEDDSEIMVRTVTQKSPAGTPSRYYDLNS